MATSNRIRPLLSQRITGTIFLSESLFGAAFIATLTLLSVNAALLSGSDTLSGVPTTVGLVARAGIAVPIGWLMDRAGRRTGMALGYALGIVGMFVGIASVQAASFALLCLSAAIIGMNNATSQQARYIASEVWVPHKRARIIGLIVFAGTVGAIGGPLLVGPASAWAETLGLAANSGPYLAGAFFLVVALVLTLLLLRPDPLVLGRHYDMPEDPSRTVAVDARSVRAIFAERSVQLAVASMVIGQLVMTLIMVITPVHMHHENHSNGDISLVFMAHTLGMFGFAFMTGWLIGTLGARSMIAFGAALLVLSSILSALAGNLMSLAVALFVLGLGWNFCFVAGSALLTSALHPIERGRIQGANDMLVAMASGMGSLTTGTIFMAGGMVSVSAVGLALTLTFVALVAWLHQRRITLAMG